MRSAALIQEAADIRDAIQAIQQYFTNISATLGQPEYQVITGKNNSTMEAQIVGLFGDNIVVRKRAGDFAALGFSHLHPTAIEPIALKLRKVTLARMSASLPPATSIKVAGEPVDLIAELPTESVVRDSRGNVQVIANQGVRKQLDEAAKSLQAEIGLLDGELTKSASAQKAELRGLYARAGEPQSFVVERILSMEKFPLGEHGKYIYQVDILGNPTILVTRQTQYLSAGRGTLLLKSVGNYDVTMKDGSERTVPALVEIDQSLIDKIEALETEVEASEAAIQQSIRSKQDELTIAAESLRILGENSASFTQFEIDLKTAKSR